MSGLFGGGGNVSTTEPMALGLRVNTSVYGLPVALIYGKSRISPNLIGAYDFKAIAHTESKSAGGKGGSPKMSNTTYTYEISPMMALGEGGIVGVDKIWVGKSRYTSGASGSPLSQLDLTLFDGSAGQGPWGYLSTYHPGEALYYPSTAYVASGSYSLGSSASLDNHSFEVLGLLPQSESVVDTDPADWLVDFLTHPLHGAGFPVNQLGDFTELSAWCRATGMLISPAHTEQREAREWLKEIIESLCCDFFYADGVLSVRPFGDAVVNGSGVTFTPDLTPVAVLSDDDFLADEGELPVVCEPKSQADSYNRCTAEIFDRDNDYNARPVVASDAADIFVYGLREEGGQTWHHFCDPVAGQTAVELRKQRSLHTRNIYKFSLGWRHCWIEPFDVLAINDVGLGLVNALVRVTEIEEDDGGRLSFTAEEVKPGTIAASRVVPQAAGGYDPDAASPPVSVQAPLVFEPPLSLTGGDNEIWLAVAGGDTNYGGCSVWVSVSGAEYSRIGSIAGSARYGVLSSDLPAPSSDPDLTSILDVSLNTDGQILAGTHQDADLSITRCYVGGEYIAYSSADLVSARRYHLGYLRRGLDGIPAQSHPVGAAFARIDAAIFRMPLPAELVGESLSIKLTAFNAWGRSEQSPADVDAYTYTAQGGMPSGPANLVLQYPFAGTVLAVQWDAVAGASSYIVELWSGGVKRRQIETTATVLAYSLEDSTADGGPWRSLTIKVASQANGHQSAQSQLNAANPTPVAPSGVSATSTSNSVTISWSAITDVDLQDYQVWLDTTSGFTPESGNLKYTGTATSATVTGLSSSTNYYFRVAARDKWGAATLVYSAQSSKSTT